MGSILTAFFTFALVVVSLFLVFIILLQRANTNAGLGTAFGSGLTESTFGTDASNILTKGTIVASIAFFIISFGLYLGYIARLDDDSGESITLPQVSIEESSDESVTETEEVKPPLTPALEQTPSPEELQENTSALEASIAEPSAISEEASPEPPTTTEETTPGEPPATPEGAPSGESPPAEEVVPNTPKTGPEESQ